MASDGAVVASAPRRAAVTGVEWTAPGDLSFAQWIEQGRRIGLLGRSAAWWIGDWLRYGNVKFGERYARASRATGYDTQTLMNMVYVASRFAPSRRRETLSWSHHAELAARDEDDQDHWLERAEAERWSVRDLRAQAQSAARSELEAHDDGSREMTADKRWVCPQCGYVSRPDADAEVATSAQARPRD